MTSRDELHQLVDALPESDLVAARRFLEFLRSGEDDPLAWVLDHAPIDDEPTTPEEDREAAEAWEEYLNGHAVPLDQFRRRSLAWAKDGRSSSLPTRNAFSIASARHGGRESSRRSINSR